MWKKLATVILALALFSLFTITPAEAGDKQRSMWDGAGITLRTVALLGLLTYPHMAPPPPPLVVYSPSPQPYYPLSQRLRRLIMLQATGKRLGNGFREPGKGSGSPVTTIAGEIGWQDIMKIAKTPDII
jgi:hypothetical protein